MKVKIGDKVKFLNDVGGGTITKIIDNETAYVLNETGFEIPVLIEELMPEIQQNDYKEVAEKTVTEPKINIFEEKPIYTASDEVNLYLAYVPKNQEKIGDSDCDVYLINDSNFFVYYNYAVKKGEQYVSINGKIEPNVKERISEIELNSIQDNLNLVVQLLFFSKEKYSIKEPISHEFKINSVKFFKQNSFSENDFFDEFAMLIAVTESNAMSEAIGKLKKEDFIKVTDEKAHSHRINRPRTFTPKEDKNIKEIDLHIHELIDDESGMSDQDKLEHQLNVFHKELKKAIEHNYRRVVFIHGVGSGSLKLKIRSELQHKYKQYQFQDASFQEYGYGATMILLRK